MRKKLTVIFGLISCCAWAQDSLKTMTLNEVVVSGTKFDVPVEKSGKTIFKLSKEDLERNAGKTLGDLLNEVPGVQVDGNFGTPGTNQGYYVRGGRNKNTLILIDGVPFNDPSAINAEYDLRFIPLSQIDSIEVLKGGLSTLYGTGAAAGVISIKLKEPLSKFSGNAEVTAGSFGTYSENVQVSGRAQKFSYLVSGNNMSSVGFSSAQDNDATKAFDKDGFHRQNFLLKTGYEFTDKFSLGLVSAYEQFEADYDDYEFTDANNTQKFRQFRIGITPKLKYAHGDLEGKIFINNNHREFYSAFPSEYSGQNFQGEVINRHHFSESVQMLSGLNIQSMSIDQPDAIDPDSAHFSMVDPYSSLLVNLPIGFSLHAGVRLNTHSVYGNKFVYNINPSFVFNQKGDWKYKVLFSLSTSYITPSLYQLYSTYGNKNLNPEEAQNIETGFSIYHDRVTFNATWFTRDEKSPIDFVSLFDVDGNYIGGQYRNIVATRNVKGIELSTDVRIHQKISLSANFTKLDTDRPTSFYKIPKTKYGAALNFYPNAHVVVSVKYNFTGDRATFDFFNFTELTLKHYDLMDLFASYKFAKDKLNIFGSVNNLFDENFVAVYGYTTRGRNFTIGARYTF